MAIYTHTFWGASQGGGKEFEGVLTADLITQEHTHTRTDFCALTNGSACSKAHVLMLNPEKLQSQTHGSILAPIKSFK